ncbi:HU family DNA-binding protein [Roseobacteraceae bacterium S113]
MSETVPVTVAPALKKQELVEKVVRRCGAKKRDAKPVIDAMLAVLGEALAEGREFNLEPLGKSKVNRVKQLSGAKVSVVKFRQKSTEAKTAEKDAQDPLAPAAE